MAGSPSEFSPSEFERERSWFSLEGRWIFSSGVEPDFSSSRLLFGVFVTEINELIVSCCLFLLISGLVISVFCKEGQGVLEEADEAPIVDPLALRLFMAVDGRFKLP